MSRRGKYISGLEHEQVHNLKVIIIDALLHSRGHDLKVRQFVRDLTGRKSLYKADIDDIFGECGTNRQRTNCLVGIVDKLIGERAIIANGEGLWTGNIEAYKKKAIDLTEAPATVNA